MSLPLNLSQVQTKPVWNKTRQSPPLDLSQPYDESTLRGKHALITGGASGFGAAITKRWAAAGASVVIGDVNARRAEQTVADVRRETGNDNVWFVQCDVRSWDSQEALFREAARLSPHGGIDVVMANAGVSGEDPFTEQLVRGSAPKAKGGAIAKPDLRTVEINLLGVIYTSYLAIHWLGRNPGSAAADSPRAGRDRHLLLVGSIASVAPIAGAPLYGAAKHGVLGLFRSLRSTSFMAGVRVNLLLPYFILTDIVPVPAKLMLAGGGTGSVAGVVEGATRLAADTRVLGRALAVGPKVKIRQEDDGDWVLVALSHETGSRFRPVANGAGGSGSKELDTDLWEAYADDFENSDIFTLRLTSLLNGVTVVRGWVGYVVDIAKIFLTPVRRLIGA